MSNQNATLTFLETAVIIDRSHKITRDAGEDGRNTVKTQKTKSADNNDLTRRERKKRETRRRIYAAAFELFVEQGFDQTTVEFTQRPVQAARKGLL